MLFCFLAEVSNWIKTSAIKKFYNCFLLRCTYRSFFPPVLINEEPVLGILLPHIVPCTDSGKDNLFKYSLLIELVLCSWLRWYTYSAWVCVLVHVCACVFILTSVWIDTVSTSACVCTGNCACVSSSECTVFVDMFVCKCLLCILNEICYTVITSDHGSETEEALNIDHLQGFPFEIKINFACVCVCARTG